MTYSSNIELVLQILKNEVDGDVQAALAKMSEDYSMTWMYQGKEKLFPSTGKTIEKEMNDAYAIKGRKYEIRNITESESVVMVEMLESYPDPESGKIYITPQVLVLELEGGKIKKGRHYCDPRVSHMELENFRIDQALNGTENKFTIQ